MRSREGENTFLKLCLLGFVSFLLIGVFPQFNSTSSQNNYSYKSNKTYSLKENYDKQKKIEEERTRKCLWYLQNSYKGEWYDQRYIFWNNNTITVINTRSKDSCDSIENYVLNKTYFDFYYSEGEKKKSEKQYVIERNDNKSFLVLYTKYGSNYNRYVIYKFSPRN